MVEITYLNEATAPAAINTDDPLKNINITAGGNAFGDGGWMFLLGGSGTAGNNNGGFVSLQSGTGIGSGNGGDTTLSCGESGESGLGGNIVISSGAGVFPSGAGGNVTIASNTGPGGAGYILVLGANGPNDIVEDGPGFDGSPVTITSGNGGHAFAANGDGGDGGDITFTLGDKGFHAGTGEDGLPGHFKIVGLESFADDAAAATGGVPVGGLYRTASAIKIRVA